MSIEIPATLLSSVYRGTAVLFLGAGASRGATHPNSMKIPDGLQLRDLISDAFLGGKLKDRTLAAVADFAINETSLISLQQYLQQLFNPFGPEKFHELISEFKWHGIATTNYDMIIEQVYENSSNSAQHLIPFIKNGQHVETEMKRYSDGVQYLKLHGSIANYTDLDIPLIISTEQYASYITNRNRLFTRLEDWGEEFPIIFCGYSISDPNIRAALPRLFAKDEARPRYYVVTPDMDAIEVRYWEKNRVTHIAATTQEFLEALKLNKPIAGNINTQMGGGTSTLRKFYGVASAPESPELITFLRDDVDHVRADMPFKNGEPKDFYRGYDEGWYSIASNLDVRRPITDEVVIDSVLEESPDSTAARLFVLKGPGGNGKSICLKRAAWMTAVDYDKPVLFLRKGGAIRRELLEELATYIKQRLFFFVDQAGTHSDELEQLLAFAKARGFPITIFTAERSAEWNVRCEGLEPWTTKDYPVRYLSEREIGGLIEKLREHKSLGLLEPLSFEEQKQQFLQIAERQLLVALHQVTLGKPFEHIVLEEYDRILSTAAQRMYLDVCTLNRFGVDVRAGLISRVSGTRFTDFESAFFRPLEHLVESRYDKYISDYVYKARHRRVAEMVFQQVLGDPERRYDQIIYILDGMNIDYASDNEAFGELIRGRALAEAFPSVELGRKLYQKAKSIAGNEPFVLQQHAIFEMEHRGGSLDTADRLIREAIEAQPYNLALKNTYANILRRQALESQDPLLRQTLRKRARATLSSANKNSNSPYSFNTLARVALDDLADLISAGAVADDERAVVEAVREVELALTDGMQKFPQDEHLMALDAEYRQLINQHTRAEKALETAFKRNPRLDWIAARLSKFYVESGRIEEARQVIVKVLQENPSSPKAHYAAAKFFMQNGTSDERQKIVDHLRRSYTPGDSNYDAQFWYARELFVLKKYDDAYKIFEITSTARHVGKIRNLIRGIVKSDEGWATQYTGRIDRLDETYAFIKSPEFPRGIYVHRSNVAEDEWAVLAREQPVKFSLGFTFRGPTAASLTPH